MKKIITLFVLTIISACSTGNMDIYDAARKGNLEIITKAHSKNKKNIDIPNHRGHTPLILACYRNQPKAAELLIKLGVNVNYSCDLGTALHAAVYQNNLKITKLLLKKSANINVLDSDNKTPLILAIHNSSTKFVSH